MHLTLYDLVYDIKTTDYTELDIHLSKLYINHLGFKFVVSCAN